MAEFDDILDVTEEETFETLASPPPSLASTKKTGGVDVLYDEGLPKDKPPPPKEIGRFKGEIPQGTPKALEPIAAKAAVAEATFEYAVGKSRLKHGGALSQSYIKFAEIQEMSADKINELNEKHFSVWESENELFKKEIDEARALKVNPQRYSQSIGRGGRVASTFAVGVSQLAAGAGNVGSVIKRIEAAIERDVAAQEFNIKQAWMGVQAIQGQQDRERRMLGEYITYKERAKAIHYTALAARAGAIKQNAENESIYLSMQMIEDRFNAAGVKSIADALAKSGTFYLDMSISSMHDLLQAQGYSTQAQKLLQMPGPEAQALEPTQLRMLDGETVGPPVGEAAAPAPQPAAPPPDPPPLPLAVRASRGQGHLPRN